MYEKIELIIILILLAKSLILFIKRRNYTEDVWSIGLYEGDNILNLKPKLNINNPILTKDDVTDINAGFIADPFIVRENNKFYMFFEVMDKDTNKGVIGLAISDDVQKWDYHKIVLSEEYHLSYPYVFEWNSEYYMIPECGTSGYLNLYKAERFPYEWSLYKNILRGNYADSSIFRYEEKWWILAEKKEGIFRKNDNLHLYYSDTLEGAWQEHIKSPIVNENSKISRPAGRVFVDNNRIIRFSQDDSEYYGKEVNGFEITKLTISEYEEKELGVITSSSNISGMWNEKGMHQVDVFKLDNNEIIAVVDGKYHFTGNRIFDRLQRLFCCFFRIQK